MLTFGSPACGLGVERRRHHLRHSSPEMPAAASAESRALALRYLPPSSPRVLLKHASVRQPPFHSKR